VEFFKISFAVFFVIQSATNNTVIYNLLPLNGYSGTTAGSGPRDFGGCNNFTFWNIIFEAVAEHLQSCQHFWRQPASWLFYKTLNSSSTHAISVSPMSVHVTVA